MTTRSDRTQFANMSQYKTEGLPRRERRSVDGLLLLDKPIGITSNAALQRVKRLFRARKAGHTGSLDPLASGMLPLCFGQGTKVSAYLLDADKTYRVTACFGTQTDTADADGSVIAESQVKTVERAALEQALEKLTGDIEQVPPMYSALKKDGKRLYELARQGIEVERPARPVTIRSLAIEVFDPAAPVIRVECSKGTYVRTLVEDLAGLLGVAASERRTVCRGTACEHGADRGSRGSGRRGVGRTAGSQRHGAQGIAGSEFESGAILVHAPGEPGTGRQAAADGFLPHL